MNAVSLPAPIPAPIPSPAMPCASAAPVAAQSQPDVPAATPTVPAHVITDALVEAFRHRLADEERSAATVRKYLHDLTAFRAFAGEGAEVTKELVVAYKRHLVDHYRPTSVNSMLAAVNRFLREAGWGDCTVRSLRIQHQPFRNRDRELTRAEYIRLVNAARARHDERLSMLMQTICSTGIRVGELQFITVEALAQGRTTVSFKGKERVVLIPAALCRALKEYARARGIEHGSVFVTRGGRPLDRSNILHSMKSLCKTARVACQKVFPHNLRHLFACLYYQAEKDLSHLADLLGHSNVNTTRIYTCVSGDEQVRQIERLGLVLT